jgi:hypothetical protein
VVGFQVRLGDIETDGDWNNMLKDRGTQKAQLTGSNEIVDTGRQTENACLSFGRNVCAVVIVKAFSSCIRIMVPTYSGRFLLRNDENYGRDWVITVSNNPLLASSIIV